MKIKWIVKLLLVIAGGMLVGQRMAHDYIHWGHLGRDAFLAHEAQRYDTVVTVASSRWLLTGVLLSLGAAAIYEFAALADVKLLSVLSRNKQAVS